MNNKNNKKFPKILLVVIMVGLFTGGIFLGRTTKICEICEPREVNFSLFWQAWEVLEKNFVDPSRIDPQQMIYGAIEGAVKTLDDPYTTFLKPEDSKKFMEDVKGVFEGVGMEIGLKKGQLVVIAPLEGTPAQKAGLRAGDKIVEINQESTRDITIDRAVHKIRGPKGTTVTLGILREGWKEVKQFEITRGVIEIPSLKWKLLGTDGSENPKGTIAYLKLYHFSEKARSDFKDAALEIIDSSAEKIILDLRNNPGGYLPVAQDIGGWFLKRGQVITIEDFGQENRTKKHLAKGNEKLLKYPVVVLINQGSASGSEILAAALRDNRGVKLIGEQSFGKGSVQKLQRLRQGSSLKITIAHWLTPKGKLISDQGLEPDLKIKMTSEDYQQDRDPQLDQALKILKGES